MKPSARSASTPPPIAFFTAFAIGVLTIVICRVTAEYFLGLSRRETLRVTSPDEKIDAVFVEPRLRLITNESYFYLVPKGEPAPPWDSQVTVTNLKEAKLRWIRPGVVEVHYNQGCVTRFSNFWRSDQLFDSQRFIEVRLAPGTELPCTDPAKPKPTVLPLISTSHPLAGTRRSHRS